MGISPRRSAVILFAACACLLPSWSLGAQSPPAQKPHSAVARPHVKSPSHPRVRAVFVSDIHFEPFRDPEKVPQLIAAPAQQWKAILASAPSSDRDAQFAKLEQTCHTRGEDTSYELYASSLQAIRTAAPDAKFVAVGGDLLSHAFTCKFNAVVPQADPGAYQSFAEKTVEFVLAQLRSALPNAPVYAALGNNDSGCGDYKLDEHGSFLSHLADPIAEDFPPAVRERAGLTFADAGYYSAPLPAPLDRVRLLVLDDAFMSRKYATCSGAAETAGAETQLAWLRQQLAEARQHKQHVWVMGHIPPGIDPYSTAVKLRNVCGGSNPEMFLSSDDLPNLLAEYGDVIQLVLFAHTHMDEMRLLSPNAVADSVPGRGVAVKLIPSISPINGNAPSFTVATIDAATATLADYQVFAASDQIGSSWKKEYDFADAYHEPVFSSQRLNALVTGFQSDPAGTAAASSTYLQNYFVRDRSLELRLFWPQYTCALSAYTAVSYRDCVCSHPKE